MITFYQSSKVKAVLRTRGRSPAMNTNLNILQLASRLAAHSSARQDVVTENIAHADTPGYRARDLADFSETIEPGPGFSATTTRTGHIDFGAEPGGFEAADVTAFGAETPNGNTVSLEDQMMRAADVRQNHDLALGVYRKTMDILRMSLGRK
jgi:flagellar basal-body rod protein FlgB